MIIVSSADIVDQASSQTEKTVELRASTEEEKTDQIK